MIGRQAAYENQQDAVKATPELLEQYLFDTPYAHALLAFSGSPESPGPPIGLALYFFNYSTWTGRPGLYVRIYFAFCAVRSCPAVSLVGNQQESLMETGGGSLRETGI